MVTNLLRLRGVLFAAVLLLMPLPLVAQTGLAGSWAIDMSAYLPNVGTPCVYQGILNLSTTNSTWSGPMSLSLVSGPADCPARLSGTCNASLDGSYITGTLSSTTFGDATFDGNLAAASTASGSGPTAMRGDLRAAEQNANAAGPLTAAGTAGNLAVTGGSYKGTGGTWSAVRVGIQIPTLARGGLALLIVLILAAASALLLLRRRQMA